MTKKTSIAVLLALMACSGCMGDMGGIGGLPEYTKQNIGPVVYEKWSGGLFQTKYGYVDPDDPQHTIHIKKKNLFEILTTYDPDFYILRHEQLHSFELTIKDNNFREYYNYISDLESAMGREVVSEDLPMIYFWGWGDRKKIVTDFINGKYKVKI